MRPSFLSTLFASFMGGILGFAGMAFIAYGLGAGEEEQPGFSEPSMNVFQAQVSTAKAEWSQAYWLKRLTLAIEAEEKTCLGNEKFVRALRSVLRDEPTNPMREVPLFEPLEPHAPEP